MITKNGIKIIQSCAFNRDSVSLTKYDGDTVTFSPTTNTLNFQFCQMMYGRCESGNYPGVYFGTGSTPAQNSDINLESRLTSGLTVVSPSAVGYNETDNGVECYCTYQLTNKTSSDIIIREIGLFGCPSSSLDSSSYLLERTVLAAQIEIPAGGIKQVTYTIRFNYPTA